MREDVASFCTDVWGMTVSGTCRNANRQRGLEDGRGPARTPSTTNAHLVYVYQTKQEPVETVTTEGRSNRFNGHSDSSGFFAERGSCMLGRDIVTASDGPTAPGQHSEGQRATAGQHPAPMLMTVTAQIPAHPHTFARSLPDSFQRPTSYQSSEQDDPGVRDDLSCFHDIPKSEK